MPDNPTIFTPTDILNIVKEHLRTVNTTVVIEGVYQMIGSRAYNGGIWWYDEIKSQYDNSKLKAMVPTGIRDQVKQGDVVQLCGTISKNVNDYDGKIELILRVSSLLGKRENELTDEEIERLQLLQKKASQGSRPVDSVLESILYSSERHPRVALLFAEGSITDADFRAGVQAASGHITFEEFRQSFNNVAGLVTQMKNIDSSHYDALCIVRGGGSGLEVFDKPELATALMALATPTITAIGHEQDMPLLCKVSDRNIGTPSLLGQYFKDMVEGVNEKKSKSHAALTEKIKKQFQDQLEAGQKQNKDLQEKLTQISKANEETQKKQAEAMGKLQEQLKAQTEASAKQTKDFGDKLTKMQETNSQLQKTLEQVNTQNTESTKQLAIAKEHAKALERQLSEAKGKGSNVTLLVIMVVIIVVLIIALIVK